MKKRYDNCLSAKYDGVTITQPENAVKVVTPDYAEFTIPGGKKGDVKDLEPIKVSSLDPTGQLVFRDIKEFNRIQSEVFPVAYHSNENMLVCAPTGAGKTNIALLSIVHQIKCHMEGSVIRKNDFKVIQIRNQCEVSNEKLVSHLAPFKGATITPHFHKK